MVYIDISYTFIYCNWQYFQQRLSWHHQRDGWTNPRHSVAQIFWTVGCSRYSMEQWCSIGVVDVKSSSKLHRFLRNIWKFPTMGVPPNYPMFIRVSPFSTIKLLGYHQFRKAKFRHLVTGHLAPLLSAQFNREATLQPCAMRILPGSLHRNFHWLQSKWQELWSNNVNYWCRLCMYINI